MALVRPCFRGPSSMASRGAIEHQLAFSHEPTALILSVVLIGAARLSLGGL